MALSSANAKQNNSRAWWILLLIWAYEALAVYIFFIAPQLFGWWEGEPSQNPSTIFWLFLSALAAHLLALVWSFFMKRMRRSNAWHHAIGVFLWALPFIGVAWWSGQFTDEVSVLAPVTAPLLPVGAPISAQDAADYQNSLKGYIFWKGILAMGAAAALGSTISVGVHIRNFYAHSRLMPKPK